MARQERPLVFLSGVVFTIHTAVIMAIREAKEDRQMARLATCSLLMHAVVRLRPLYTKSALLRIRLKDSVFVRLSRLRILSPRDLSENLFKFSTST